MASTRYPNGDDLRDYITSCGLVLSDPTREEEWEAFVDWHAKQSSANEGFESATGRKFLAQTATRNFPIPNGHNGILDLSADLLSVDALTVSGRALTEGNDFLLGPEGNDLLGLPYFQIIFPRPFWPIGGMARPISITGPWGYSLQVPEGAWDGMLQSGALSCKPQLALAISQGLMVWAKGDKREEYSHYADQGPLSTEAKDWKRFVESSITSYKKVTF